MHQALTQLNTSGYSIVSGLYNFREINAMIQELDKGSLTNSANHRRQHDLFAIRQVLIEIPGLLPLVMNTKMQELVNQLTGAQSTIIKSIYFNKPAASNWFVAYHQDLMLNVEERHETAGYGPWINRSGQIAVQPPASLLAQVFTLRIHLDDTDAGNGALKVIPGTHTLGVIRAEGIDRSQEVVCEVPAGGVMLMQPLLMHASGRSSEQRPRRVIHIELTNASLAPPLKWAEEIKINLFSGN